MTSVSHDRQRRDDRLSTVQRAAVVCTDDLSPKALEYVKRAAMMRNGPVVIVIEPPRTRFVLRKPWIIAVIMAPIAAVVFAVSWLISTAFALIGSLIAWLTGNWWAVFVFLCVAVFIRRGLTTVIVKVSVAVRGIL